MFSNVNRRVYEIIFSKFISRHYRIHGRSPLKGFFVGYSITGLLSMNRLIRWSISSWAAFACWKA